MDLERLNTLGSSAYLNAQAGYESASTLMVVMMSGANYIWHSAGWDETLDPVTNDALIDFIMRREREIPLGGLN